MHLKLSIRPARLAPWLLGLALLGATALAQQLDTVLSTNLFEPSGVTTDKDDNYFISDSANNRIVKFDITTRLSVTAAGGSGSADFGAIDGRAAGARFYDPEGIVAVTNGFVIADTGNNLIRFLTLTGTVQTLAGDAVAAQIDHDSGAPPDTAGFKDGTGAEVQFNTPKAVASDGKGNIFIADAQNGAIRKLRLSDGLVTTIATNFSRPSGVAVDDAGRIYVSDTGNNAIKLINTNGAVTLLAGSGNPFVSGTSDGSSLDTARFNGPQGLAWIEDAGQLIIADSGNGLIRRINGLRSGDQFVDTLVSKSAGLINPVALVRGADGAIVIADRAANAVRAFRGAGLDVQVAPPDFGVVVMTNAPKCMVSEFRALMVLKGTNFLANNDVVFAIQPENGDGVDLGVQTFYTIGDTDPLNPIPNPTSTDSSPPRFFDCDTTLPPTLIFPVHPDVTIKAVSTRVDRRPSSIITARFRFEVANPRIIGDNPASFNVDSETFGATIWYTSGPDEAHTPDPTNASPSQRYTGTPINIGPRTNDVYFKMRAFRQGYAPSSIVKRLFIHTNAVFSTLGAPYNLNAGIGASILVPIEVELAPNDAIGSLEYRVDLYPLNSALTPQITYVRPGLTDFIVASGSTNANAPQFLENFQNGVTNGLAVGHLGANGTFFNLLIQTTDLLRIQIPETAQVGDRYEISFRNISATGTNGTEQLVDVIPLTPKTITVTNTSYLVGDASPGLWYNAGEFGDNALNNNDVNLAFAASFGFQTPFRYSDEFNAMDAFPLDTPDFVGGDGQIRFLDWQVSLRRALGLDPTIWRRRRSAGGIIISASTNNPNSALSAAVQSASVMGPTNIVWRRPAMLRAMDTPNTPQDTTVSIPVRMDLRPTEGVSGMQFLAVVAPVGNQGPLNSRISFVAASGVPSPSGQTNLLGDNSIAVYWNVETFNPPLQGTNVLGSIQFKVPTTALTGGSYVIYFTDADGSFHFQKQIDFDTFRLNLQVASAGTSVGALLPDEWQKKFFETVESSDAAPALDPDGDGAFNYVEYLDGTNPTANDLSLSVTPTAGNDFTLSWFAATGLNYTLETTSASDPTHWTTVGTRVGNGQVNSILYTNPTHSPAQLFRVRVN